MNILFVCHRYPFPPNRGGKIRPFNMIRHLSQRHRVVVATLAHSQEELAEGAGLQQHCHEVLAEVVPSSRRWLNSVAALPTPAASSARYFWSARLHDRIQQLQSRMPIDAVIVHCAFVADYVRDLRARFRMLDLGDLDSRKWADYSQYRAFPWSAGYALEAFKLQRVERNLAAKFQQCTVTAQGELDSYRELGVSTPCQVIPNGVDSDYFRPSSGGRTESKTIVFLGRMDYYPNVSGVIGFVKDVLPLVRERVPDIQLKIVGSNPLPKIRALEQVKGVSVTGSVPDIRPYVNQSAVAIAPIAIARGTQNKVLECMAMGVPVVVSPQVAKGVQAQNGRDFLTGHTPAEFSRHVIDLIRDPELQARTAESARRQVVTAHDWSESMKLLDQLLEEPARAERQPASSVASVAYS